ncbi:MAG: hypothetical protein ACPLKP_01670 [Microgenomates group bacterium]
MGKEDPKRRSMKIKQSHKRAKKLAKLRQLYIKAQSKEEKEKIWEKAFKIAPWLSLEEFLKPLQKAS